MLSLCCGTLIDTPGSVRAKTWWDDLKSQSHAALQIFHLIKDTSAVKNMWGRPHLSQGYTSCPYSYPLVLRRKWCFGLQQWEEFDFLLFLPHVFVLTACSWDMCHMFRASLGIMGWWPRQECRRAHQGCSVLHVSFDGFSGSCFLEAIESHSRPRTTLPSVQGTNAFPKYFTVCLGGFFFFV